MPVVPVPARAPAWTPSQTERRAAVEAGGTVLADMRCDRALIAWAAERGLYARVDAPTRWGNPFAAVDGDRQAAIARYRAHLAARPDLLARLGELRGKVLGCWCHPGACHAAVLIELLAAADAAAE